MKINPKVITSSNSITNYTVKIELDNLTLNYWYREDINSSNEEPKITEHISITDKKNDTQFYLAVKDVDIVFTLLVMLVSHVSEKFNSIDKFHFSELNKSLIIGELRNE